MLFENVHRERARLERGIGRARERSFGTVSLRIRDMTFGGAEVARCVFFPDLPVWAISQTGCVFSWMPKRRFVPSVSDCASKRFRPRTRGNF
jgi:hypothetical protein